MIIKDFKNNVSKLIDAFIVEQRHKNKWIKKSFHASGITDCPRALMFSIMNLDEKDYPAAKSDTAKGYKLMDHGSAIHDLIQKYFQKMGVLKEEDTEKKLEIDELHFHGKCDGILTFDDGRVLLEIKTIGSRGYQSLTQPKEGHFYQAQAYLHFLNKNYGEKLEEILLYYVDRNSDNLDAKEFWCPKDDQVAVMIINKLSALKEYLKKEEIVPIPKTFSPENKNFIPCCWCPFNTPELCLSKKNKMSEFKNVNLQI
jgi:CRISPR/Cas system-associated exonuclease Cas4 (RecB family)